VGARRVTAHPRELWRLRSAVLRGRRAGAAGGRGR
jgi:hypothetical protein